MKLNSLTMDIAAPTTRERLLRDERVAEKALSTPDEERERYVMDLKRRVQDDTYHPSAREIAEAILVERIADNTVL